MVTRAHVNFLLLAAHLCLQVVQLLLFLSCWDLDLGHAFLMHGSEGSHARGNEVRRLALVLNSIVARWVGSSLELVGQAAAEQANDRAVDHVAVFQPLSKNLVNTMTTGSSLWTCSNLQTACGTYVRLG